MPSDVAYLGQAHSDSDVSEFHTLSFIIDQAINRVCTSTMVQVMSVTNAGGISPVGYVDVLPLVNQIDGYGNATPHGVVHHLPYVRVQGGANAIILDPQVGDKGIAIFADHDISAVKASGGQNIPGSRRRFDMADGMYIGGLLNGTPTQYLGFSASGLTAVSPVKVSTSAPTIAFDAPTDITQNAGTITLTATTSINMIVGGHTLAVTSSGVSLDGILFGTHYHADPQGGDTGPPL